MTVTQGELSAKVFISQASFGGADYAIAFSTGDAIAIACFAPVWIPIGDAYGDHCP